jgi:hypothetical protein
MPRHARPLLVLATCVASVSALAQTASAKPKVAILGIEVTGGGATDEKTIEAAKQITKELRREANRPSGNFEVAPDTQKDLLEIKMLSDCSDEGRRCMSEIGQQLGAQRLIYGKLERKKGRYEVSLKLLNTESRELEEQVTESISFDDMTAGDALSRRARAIYAKLSGAPVEAGLSITANAERGSVLVDGKIKTNLSAGSAHLALSPGDHTIAIEAEGYAKYETEVTAEAGATATLRAQLVELESGDGDGDDGDGDDDGGARPGSGWRMAFWTGVVVTGAAGAAWTYSGFKVLSSEDDLNDASESAAMPEGAVLDSKGNYEDACRDFKGTNGAGAGDVNDACEAGRRHRNLVNYAFMPVTIAGALFSAFALYKGYIAPGGSSSSEREARRRARRKNPIVVAPSIGPDLVGAGIAIEF